MGTIIIDYLIARLKYLKKQKEAVIEAGKGDKSDFDRYMTIYNTTLVDHQIKEAEAALKVAEGGKSILDTLPE